MNTQPFSVSLLDQDVFMSAEVDPLHRVNDVRRMKRTYQCKNYSIALLESGSVLVTAKSNEGIIARIEIVATGIVFKKFMYRTCSASVLQQNKKINSSAFGRYSGTCARVDVETLLNGIVRIHVFPQSSLASSGDTKEDAQIFTVTSEGVFRSQGEANFVARLTPEK